MKRINGASLVEYGVVAGLVAIVSISAVTATGNEISEVFSSSQATLESKISASLSGGEDSTSGVVEWTSTFGTVNANIVSTNSGTGSLTITKSGPFVIEYHQQNTYTNTMYLFVTGNKVDEMTGLTLACDNGFDQPIPTPTYSSGPDNTRFSMDNTGFVYADGDTDGCRLY